MLSVPFTRRQLRRTSCVALLAWVFALLSGVANACLFQPVAPDAASLGLSTVNPTVGAAAAAAPRDRQAVPAHPHVNHDSSSPAQDGGKASCLKFCTDESSALAKSKASQADLPGPMVLASVRWHPATPVAALVAPWPLVERPATVGPPLFLRLLRLTI